MTTNVTISWGTAERAITALLAAHQVPSDAAARPLAALLRECGVVEAQSGSVGHDYAAIIDWDGRRWLVEDNNAWTRVCDPADADCDVAAV